MENDQYFKELEEMRDQIALLNKKLEKESIVNERLLRDAIKSKANAINANADRVMDFESTDNLKKYKFIDGVMYTDQIKAEIKKLLNIKDKDEINQVAIADAAAIPSDNVDNSNKIAVYFCEGSIVQQAEQGIIMGGNSGTTYVSLA